MEEPALQLTRPVALLGLMGAGKSTVGRLLARSLGVDFLDLDHWIEQQDGRRIREIFQAEGEESFRKKESEALESVLSGGWCGVLATGGGVVEREENRAILAAGCLRVYLKATVRCLLSRTAAGHHRPLLQQAPPDQVLQALSVRREPWYAQADLVIEVDELSSEQVAHVLHEEISFRLQVGNSGG